jgi:hypothetical protein
VSFRIDTIGGKVYWAAYAADVIRRANLDGSQVEDIVTEVSSVRDIEKDVENDYIYWTDNKGLYRADMKGGQPEVLIESSIGPGLITINYNENKIYWVDKNGATTVKRANMDGSGVETVLTRDDDNMLSIINDMIFDNKNNLLYWNDYSPGSGGYRIMCAEPDGGSVREVLAGFGPVKSSVIDPVEELIYWTTGRYREVMKANVDGTGVHTVLRLGFALGTPHKGTIALDRNADLLYWGYTTQPWGTFTRVSTTGEGYESFELDL